MRRIHLEMRNELELLKLCVLQGIICCHIANGITQDVLR
jgi:hypothetical protein